MKINKYDKKTCCICGKSFIGYGNNPYPVVDDLEAKCCDECNMNVVIPERLANLIRKERKNEGTD